MKKKYIYIIIAIVIIIIPLYVFLTRNNKSNTNEFDYVVFVRRREITSQEIIDNLGKDSLLKSFENYYVLSSDSLQYIKNKEIGYTIVNDIILQTTSGYKVYKVGVNPPMTNQKIQDIGVDSVVIDRYPFVSNELLVWAIDDISIAGNKNVRYFDKYRLYEKVNPDIFDLNGESDVQLTFIVHNNNYLSQVVELIGRYDENLKIVNDKKYLREDIYLQDIKAKLNNKQIIEILYQYPELIIVDII